ncbi:hypothetical protein [Proteiniphilum sp.]|uniref:hypothetical protein n=1 Tax=Proteiniphilum sp. TaxID=1926877 RepID=UPI00331D6654
MRKQTIISTPSITDTNILVSRWRAIPGNSGKSLSEFYAFLTVESVDRTLFLADHTVESYDDVKGDIVVLKVTPK